MLPQNQSNSKSLGFLIYFNHLLSSWGDRMWDFAVGLYLVILYPESLLVTAILGFAICLSVIILGSHLGSWIDKSHRLRVATAAIIIQNSFVIFGTLLLGLNIVYLQEIQLFWTNGFMQYLVFAAIIFCAVVANLASIVSDIVIEKDWIVVFNSGNEHSLATMNAILRTIDLTTLVLAPLILGQIITYGSQLSGVIFIGVWNLVSALVEYKLLRAIYTAIPELDQKIINSADSTTTLRTKVRESWKGWRMYFRHPIRFAGISFAMLFMTVMGFDSITAGYIYSQGGSESLIGAFTGVGAIFGILGSITYPYLRDNIGKYSTGNIGLSLNTLFLLFCVGSVFGPGSPFQPLSILHPFVGTGNEETVPEESLSFSDLWNQKLNVFYFVFGIILARFGLWIGDLNINQIIQESVEESHRGVINGVQNSLNQLADLFKFFLVIVFPSPSAFGYLIFATWMFSLFSWGSFIVFSLSDGSLSRSSSSNTIEADEEQYLLQKTPKKYTVAEVPTAPVDS